MPKGLKLEIIVRPGDIVVNDRNSGPLKTLPNLATGYDLDQLSEFMRRVKSQYPEMTDATVLLDPTVAYDSLVQVMELQRPSPTATSKARTRRSIRRRARTKPEC